MGKTYYIIFQVLQVLVECWPLNKSIQVFLILGYVKYAAEGVSEIQ